MSSLQLLATFLIVIALFKIIYMLLNKDGMNKFIKSYYSSMSNRPWFYHNIYIILAIGTLYILKTNGLSYVEILGTMMFFSFMINAAFTSYPKEMFSNLTLDNINWKMLSAYMIIFLYIMAKAICEIFFIN